jgi:hypothetical protein
MLPQVSPEVAVVSIVATRVSVLEPTVNVQLTRNVLGGADAGDGRGRVAKARSDPPAGSVRLVTLVGELADVGTEAVLLVVANSDGSAGSHETLPRTHAQTAQRLPAGGPPQARTYAVLAWDGETRPESVGELRPHFPDSPRGAQMDLGSPGS